MLTEERDIARSHEEDLFAKLTDKTEDLEALQESYVSLTDRYALANSRRKMQAKAQALAVDDHRGVCRPVLRVSPKLRRYVEQSSTHDSLCRVLCLHQGVRGYGRITPNKGYLTNIDVSYIRCNIQRATDDVFGAL